MADLIDRDALLNDLKESVKAAREWKEEARDEEIKIRAEQAHGTFIECALRVKNAPAVNRWIPVEDALPEDGQRVLICSKSKRLFDVVFRANAQMPSFDTKIFGKVYAWCCADVIKWMPLPESPENE
jgi:hypothetical protein